MDKSDYQNTPKGKYVRQRINAKHRNIAWEFTFETWWKVWEDSGHWEDRGLGRNAFCMCRNGDTGPYSLENVQIKTLWENSYEASYRRHTGKERLDPFRRYERATAWDYPCENLDKVRAALKNKTEKT